MNARAWTKDELRSLGRIDGATLDGLLTDDEKAALHEYLRLLAVQRQRVEAESRDLRLP